jgi:hypothetical protein
MNKEPGVRDLAQADDKPYMNNKDGPDIMDLG